MEAIDQSATKFLAWHSKESRDLIRECRYHLLNETSAKIMQRKFHKHDTEFNIWCDRQKVDKLNVMKTFIIENYANHLNFEKVIAIDDTEILLYTYRKRESFLEFNISNLDYTKWSCCQFMPKDAFAIRMDCLLLD